MRAIGFWVLFCLCLAGPSFGSPVRFRAGKITAIQGTVALRSPSGQRNLRRGDVSRAVYVGDSVHCSRSSFVSILFRNGKRRTYGPKSGWNPIRLFRTSEEEAIYAKLTGGTNPLRSVHRAAVKPKAPKTPIVLNKDCVPCRFFEIVLPEGFTSDVGIRVLHLSGGSSTEVFSTDGYSGIVYNGSSLVESLRAQRRKGIHGPFTAEVHDRAGNSRTLNDIYLMEEPLEKRLFAALSQADQEKDPYARGICRTLVFKRFGLMEMAQREFGALPPN